MARRTRNKGSHFECNKWKICARCCRQLVIQAMQHLPPMAQQCMYVCVSVCVGNMQCYCQKQKQNRQVFSDGPPPSKKKTVMKKKYNQAKLESKVHTKGRTNVFRFSVFSRLKGKKKEFSFSLFSCGRSFSKESNIFFM